MILYYYESLFDINHNITKAEEHLIAFLKLDEKNFNKDYLLEKKINISELPDEIKNPILAIPKINKIYVCKNCEKIHYIQRVNNESSIPLYFQFTCPFDKVKFNRFGLHIIEPYLKLIEVKKDINNENGDFILPFKKAYELVIFFTFIELYHKIKEKIKEYNYGDTKQNIAFTLFENLLSNVLYNKNENKIYWENLLFYSLNDFTIVNYNFFAMYNKIHVLPNGKRFYLKIRKEINVDEIINEDKIRDCQFYELHKNIYCLILAEEPIRIIKGPLENLDFNENNEKIIYVYQYSIKYKNKIIDNNDKIICLYYILRKRQIIHIDKDLFLGLDTISNTLYLIDLQNISLNSCKLEMNDIIKRIVSLKNNKKNEENPKFILIGIQYIYLLEYINNKKEYRKLKEAKYNNEDRYFYYDIKYCCYLLKNNILIFSFSFNNEIFFFNLNTFQLNTIITFENRCESLFKINKNEIICSKKHGISLINLNNKKMKDLYYEKDFTELVFDSQYLFSESNLIGDLNKNVLNIFLANFKDSDDILNFDSLRINEKQFAIFCIYRSKNNSIKSFIDLNNFL